MTDPELIVSTVTSDFALTTLIGDRIYPVVLPTDPTLPAVTYQLASQPTERTQDEEDGQYRWPRWRFKIWSLRYADLVPIATALAAIFGDQSQTPFRRSWIEYPTHAEDHESDTHRFWRALDVIGFQNAGSAGQ